MSRPVLVRFVQFAAAAALAALFSACSTTVETTQTAAPPGRELRSDADPADAERRARVRLELASAYFGRGQTATALDELKLALAAKPDLPEAYNLRALIYASMGEPRQAEESFQRALQFNARDADAMHNYAWFLCQQRRWTDADAQFQQALSVPQYAGVTRTMLAQGVCQARSGRLLEAERTLSRSYELDPSNPVTAYNLSEVLLRRGELERARFYVKRINAVAEQVNAQSLWLAARIEHRLGNSEGVQQFGRQLSDRFPQSPEALQFGRGRFDEQ